MNDDFVPDRPIFRPDLKHSAAVYIRDVYFFRAISRLVERVDLHAVGAKTGERDCRGNSFAERRRLAVVAVKRPRARDRIVLRDFINRVRIEQFSRRRQAIRTFGKNAVLFFRPRNVLRFDKRDGRPIEVRFADLEFDRVELRRLGYEAAEDLATRRVDDEEAFVSLLEIPLELAEFVDDLLLLRRAERIGEVVPPRNALRGRDLIGRLQLEIRKVKSGIDGEGERFVES